MIDANIDERGLEDLGAWRSRLGTLVLVALGLIAFEASANPSLGVAIACLKFGWDDARDGVWLRRVDPNRQRGRACSWMYLGVGLLKASLIAFVGAVAMAIIAAQFGRQLGWPRRLLAAQLIGALGVGVFGVGFSTLASLTAVVFACHSRTKIWVGPEARHARDLGEWPPQAEPRRFPRRNRLGTTLVSMTTVVVLVAVWGVVRFLGSTFPALRQVVPLSETVGAVFIVFVVPIGSATFALTFRDFLKARVIANAPAECWPEAIHRIPIASVDDLE